LSENKELSDNLYIAIILFYLILIFLTFYTTQKTASKNVISNISTSGFYNFNLLDYPAINSAYE